MARQVAGPMPLRVALCTSEFPMATQRAKLGGGVELCVATLGRLQARGAAGNGVARHGVGWRVWGGWSGGGGTGHGAWRVEWVRVQVPPAVGVLSPHPMPHAPAHAP
jgi:hypothetical protein